MKDPSRTNQEMLAENSAIKQRIKELEHSESERKRAEEALHDSEERFKNLYQESPIPTFTWQKKEDDFILVDFNRAALQITNGKAVDYLGNSALDLYRNRPQVLNDMNLCYKEQSVVRREIVSQHFAPSRFLSVHYGFIPPDLIIVHTEDQTDRKQAEELMRALSSRQEAILAAVPEIIMEVDNNRVYSWANSVGIEFFGEDVIGKEAAFYFEGEQETYDKVSPLFSGSEDIIYIESWQRRRDGEKRLLAWWCRVLKDEDGNVTGALSSGRDITDRKLVEEELKANEEKYRTLFESSRDAIMTLAPPSWRFTTGNPATVEMFEACDEASFTALGPWEFSPEFQPDGRPSSEKSAEMIQTAMAKGSHFFEWTHRRLGGESFPATVLLTRMEIGGQALLQATVRDITESKQAEKRLQRSLDSLKKAVSATIPVMVSAVEARDPYTAGHQNRSADLARAIATEMRLPQEKIDAIRMAGSIHDIGKLSIPAEILSKPTKLSEIEFSLIKEHSHKGFEMLKNVESSWPLAEIVYQHHERMDGSGYPRNLKGEEILIEARILAVADVVEAMASHRPYRPGLGIDAALNEIEKNRGTIYDSAVADACLSLFREKGFKLKGLDYKR
jgi:PAS domain S-box-containing protein